MKLFLIIRLLFVGAFLFLASHFAFSSENDYSPFPEPDSGYVTDIANLLSNSEEEKIEKWLWQVESRSRVEIIVVVIESISDYPQTSHKTIESFATGLFNKYAIGNMSNNDGVLLLVAKSDRKARIELGGAYGHSRDSDAEKIMRTIIIPNFKDENYPKGITDGTEAIIEEFANMRIGFPWYLVWMGLAAIVLLISGISLIRNGKKGWGYVFVGLAIVIILFVIFAAIRIIQHLPTDNSSGWSSGGSGGFGGGSSGGGGATGGW